MACICPQRVTLRAIQESVRKISAETPLRGCLSKLVVEVTLGEGQGPPLASTDALASYASGELLLIFIVPAHWAQTCRGSTEA